MWRHIWGFTVSLCPTKRTPGPEAIKLFSCSAQLRLKFILLITVEMPAIVDMLTFISRKNYRLLMI